MCAAFISPLLAASVEQSAEKRTMPSTVSAAVAIMVAVVAAMVVGVITGCIAWCRLRTCATGLRLVILCDVAFDNFVEFTSIKPDASAFRAIVDFDALALAHDEIYRAKRAKKSMAFLGRAGGGSFWHFLAS